MGTVRVEDISVIEPVMLIERFQSGESDAFDEIVSRYQRQVYNLAYNFTQNCEDAYDISQEVFIKVYKSLSRLRNNSAFNAWLNRVTVNACTDYVRQRPKERTLDDFSCLDKYYFLEDMEYPDEPVENNELNRMISRAIEQLPKRQRRVFVLRHYDGLPLKDIARTLDCSLGTVKAHLFRATRRLRKLLRPYLT